MKDMLLLTGPDALTLSKAANRQAEVFDGSQWRTASGLPEATRYGRIGPALVRLKAPARVLVEDLLHLSIQPGSDLNATIQRARLDRLHPLAAEIVSALDIIQREINT